ncbi:MAG TPA: PEGA domain-containing protein [Kofleriaceae bacterium]|nr:PEGA domain-containing protein [Kofleriaceae bacterium]
MRSGYFTALVAGALTALGLAVLPARAEARPYPVRIDSQPSGATVYLDSKEGEPLGQTPYNGRLSAGPHTLIVELDGYVSQVQDINIRRGRHVQRIDVRLSKIDLASIEVVLGRAGGRKVEADGARILVDGRDVGAVPDTIQVPAGPHQVEVVLEGYKTFETWVETAEGEKLKVTADLVPLGGKPVRVAQAGAGATADDVPGEGEGTTPGSRAPRRVAAAEDNPLAGKSATTEPEGTAFREKPDAAPARVIPFVTLGAGLELGGRRFRPNSEDVQGLRKYDAGGVLMVRLSAEVNPLAAMQSRLASGWGLYAAYARATPLDSTAELMDGTEVEVPTVWSELDLGARYRYRFRPDSYLGIEGGYGTHTFTFDFSADTEELAEEVPDVSYKFVRIGLEGRLGLGRISLLGTGGTRLVSSIGDLGDRFAKTDILALSGSLGMAVTVTSSIEARLVAHYDHYAHDYTPGDGAPSGTATSGLDQFFGALLSALFVY